MDWEPQVSRAEGFQHTLEYFRGKLAEEDGAAERGRRVKAAQGQSDKR